MSTNAIGCMVLTDRDTLHMNGVIHLADFLTQLFAHCMHLIALPPLSNFSMQRKVQSSQTCSMHQLDAPIRVRLHPSRRIVNAFCAW